jgi:hypothetical protein
MSRNLLKCSGYDEETIARMQTEHFQAFLRRHPWIAEQQRQELEKAIQKDGIRYRNREDGSVRTLAPQLTADNHEGDGNGM